MKKIFRLGNLDVLFIIIISFVITLMSILNSIKQEFVASSILALLAVLSIVLLRTRLTIQSLEIGVAKIVEEEDVVSKVFTKEIRRDNLIERLKKSDECIIMGIILHRTIPSFQDEMIKLLDRKGGVRIIMINPKNDNLVAMAALRNKDHNKDENRAIAEARLNAIKNIKRRTSSSRIEVRLVDYLVPYQIFGFDLKKDNGFLLIRLSTFDIPNEERPTFKLEKANNREWFEFYVEQFEKVWKVGTKYQL